MKYNDQLKCYLKYYNIITMAKSYKISWSKMLTKQKDRTVRLGGTAQSEVLAANYEYQVHLLSPHKKTDMVKHACNSRAWELDLWSSVCQIASLFYLVSPGTNETT